MITKDKHPILNSSIMGYAHHRILLDAGGNPVDYEFLEVNAAFEKLTGLKAAEVVGNSARSTIPGIEMADFDWIGFYGRLALEGGEQEFEQYSEPLKKWYRVHAYSTEKLYFTTLFVDITSAKQMEKELRYVSTVLENIHDSVVATDCQFKITYLNKSAEKLYGYPAAELLGQSPDIFNAEPMSREIQQELYAAVSSGKVYENISINRRKDGSLFYCDYKVKPIVDETGKVTAYVGVQRDITDSKKQTEELEAFFSVNLDLLCIADLEGNFIKTNQAWGPVLGYTTEELNHKKFLEFVHPDDMEATLAAMADLGKGNDVLEFTNRYRCKDGSYRFIEWRSHPRGKLIYAAARDVTERIEQERKLNETNRMLQTILDTIPQYVLWKDRNSVYLGCNTRAAKVAGLAHPSEIVGKNDYDLVWKKEEADFFRDCDQRVMASNAAELHIIEPQLQADGKNAWIDTTKIPLHDEKGTVNGILVAYEDITEKRAADAEQLRQAGLIKSLLTSLPDIVFYKDCEGVYLGCNPLFTELVGKNSEAEVVGKTDYDLFGKELADFFRYHDKEMLAQLAPRHNEEAVTFPDGRTILIDTLKTPYRDSTGAVIGILGISRDITERKRQEDEQKAILETCNDGFFIADSAGRVLAVNNAFCAMLGYTREELCALQIADFEGQEKPEDVARRIEKLKKEGFDRFESKNRRRDGSLIDVEISVSMMHDYADKMVVFVRDISDRKKAETGLIEYSQKLKNYVEYAPYGIFVADASGNYRLVNRAACNMTGYSAEELLTMSATGLVYEEDRQSAFEHFRKVQADGYAESEMRFVRKDGDVRYKKIVAVKLSDNEFLGFNEDITDMRTAQRIMSESNSRLKLAQEVGNVGSWEHDFSTNRVTWSEHTYTIYEQDPSSFEVNYENIIAHFHEDDREAVIQALNSSMQEKHDLRIEHRIVTKNGKLRHVLEAGRIILDENGALLKIAGSVADITEQKLAEAALRSSEQTLKTYIDASPLGIFVADMDGKYIDVNKAGEDLAGYSREELLHSSIADLIAPENLDQGLAIVRQTIEKDNGEGICLARKKNGTAFWLWIVARKVDNKYLLAFCQDVSGRIEAEQQLLLAKEQAESASKAKSEFLANMSHEIRTPLNGVIGFTELLKSTPLTAIQQQYVDNANVSGHTLLGIINDILDFSKIEAGMLHLELIKTDMIELLENSVDIVKFQAGKKNLELLLHIDPDMPRFAVTDPIRLKQVLANLLGNAVKFTAKGEVELKLAYENLGSGKGRLSFFVRDTGIGISEEQKSKLFKAFSQADSSTTRKFGGTGLGLIISDLITRELGGKILVDSTQGTGSTFRFEIITETEDGDRLDTGSLEHIKRCLVVDDNANNRLILGEMLASWGVCCEACDNGLAALKLLETVKPFDVIICDYNMPYIDGLETTRMIRQKLKLTVEKQPIILLHSSSEDAELHRKCEELGVRFRLTKPVKSHDLHAYLCRVHEPDSRRTEAVSVTAAEPQAAASGDLKILIAEDVLMNMIMIKAFIGEIYPDAVLIEAVNGLEVVRLASDVRPDLILMDVQMPELDGLEATKKIRELEKTGGGHVPIIALTAGAFKEEQEKCLQAGMDDFLTKPLEKAKLKAALEKHCDKKAEDAAKPAPDSDHFCLERLVERIGSEDIARQLVEIVLKDFPQRLELLSTAIENGDCKSILEITHQLKGAASNFGCLLLTDISVSMEELAVSDRNLPLLKQKYRQFKEEWETVRGILEP